MKTLCKEAQAKISPEQAIVLLREGNIRFMNNLKFNRNLLQQLTETRTSQHPFAVIISCMDSRAPAELIFDQGLGDIFSIRIAGNIINDEILGSAEFGCKVIGAKAVVVLGHTGCGAIKGAMDKFEMGKLGSVLNKIKPAIPEGEAFYNNLSDQEKMNLVTQNNVINSINEIRKQSSILNELEVSGNIVLIGGLYDLHNGKVTFFERESAQFERESAQFERESAQFERESAQFDRSSAKENILV
jgi:carbonic anhydrase